MILAYEYEAYQLGIPLGVHWTPSPTNPVHHLVLGPSGTGKTIFSATIAARCALHIPESRIWIASYKNDDFLSFCDGAEGARYGYFNDGSMKIIREFRSILDARLGGDKDRSFCLLWADEVATMQKCLPKADSAFVRDTISATLQTGRSLNCQVIVSLLRGDSEFFNNGARESVGNVWFLGTSVSKEAAAMFGVDRAALPPIRGRAGYYIVNGNSEAVRPVQLPIIRDTTRLEAALLAGITR